MGGKVFRLVSQAEGEAGGECDGYHVQSGFGVCADLSTLFLERYDPGELIF